MSYGNGREAIRKRGGISRPELFFRLVLTGACYMTAFWMFFIRIWDHPITSVIITVLCVEAAARIYEPPIWPSGPKSINRYR